MRTKPTFGKKDSFEDQVKNDDPAGCVWLPINIVIGYVILSVIVGAGLEYILYVGGFILVLLMMFGYLDFDGDSRKVKSAKKQWKQNSVSIDVAIVSRHHYPGGSYEINEYGETRYSRPRYSLMVKLPNQTVASVNVSESIYQKLEDRNFVRIYYKPESPMTFMLEEEIS